MKRRWTGFLAAVVMLVGPCLPVLSADAAGGAGTAALTIYYYAAGTVRKMVAAPYQAELARGSRYQVKSPSAEPFVLADPEQAVIEGTLDEDTEIRVYYSDGRKQADYTVIYIGRDGERETVLDKETFRAPAGETVNVEHKDFENFGKEAGQDMTILVTADGRAVLNLYYDREIWTVNLHEEAKHESGTSDSLLPNDDIWYTARGKYGAPLPDDFPTMEEMEEHYMGKTQFQDVQFLGVRDEFEAVGRHLDTFYFQDLAAGKSGDAVFARPLRATDERYPSDQYLESESAGRKITLKQDEGNTITFIYKKADSEGGGILPDSEQEEIMPDTGDVTKAHWAILIMTAALCLIIGPAAVRIHAFRA